jgi:hypothetical protein
LDPHALNILKTGQDVLDFFEVRLLIEGLCVAKDSGEPGEVIVDVVLRKYLLRESCSGQSLVKVRSFCAWNQSLLVEMLNERDGLLQGNVKPHIDAWFFLDIHLASTQFKLDEYYENQHKEGSVSKSF